MRSLLAPVIALGLVWAATFAAMTVATAPIGHAETWDPPVDGSVVASPEAAAGNDRYEEQGLLRVSPTEPDSLAPVPGRSPGLPLY